MTQELTIYRHEVKARAWWVFVLVSARLRVAFGRFNAQLIEACEALGRFSRAVERAKKSPRGAAE